ncbi:MAG: biotin synthase BioB, partial [Comamonadaceae bacterium]|nr:biotin synthase BioB [Comamonadaceae bacterium]
METYTTPFEAPAAPLDGGQPLVFHAPRRQKPQADAKPQRWSVQAIEQLLDLPFMDLLYQAQTVHRQHWPKGDVELATLLSVKTGGCPENCGYCPQSAEYDTGVKAQKLLS